MTRKKAVLVVKTRHVVLHHLSRHRLWWAGSFGVIGFVAGYYYHNEFYKKFGEIMTLPTMEAILSKFGE